MMRRAVFGILLLAACEGSGPGGAVGDGLNSDERALQGTWVFAGTNGATGFTFDRLGYTFQILGPLVDGSFGSEAEVGSFSTSGHTIVFAPEQWSCTGADPAYSFTFTVSASTLGLSDSTTIVTFSRSTATGGGGAVIRIGCWQDDGSFLPQPLMPL